MMRERESASLERRRRRKRRRGETLAQRGSGTGEHIGARSHIAFCIAIQIPSILERHNREREGEREGDKREGEMREKERGREGEKRT